MRNNSGKENYFSTDNWTVKGNIATHKSGITATATLSTTDQTTVCCTLEIGTKYNDSEEVDIGALTVEAALLVMEGKLSHSNDKYAPDAYDIPRAISHQYKGFGEAFGVVWEEELQKIVYFRDVMPKEIYIPFSRGDYSGLATWSKTKEAQSFMQELGVYGDIKLGYCNDYLFFDIFTPEVIADLRANRKA